MRTKEKLVKEIGDIYKHLNANMPSEPSALIIEIDVLNVWLASSSELMADAEYYQNQKCGELAEGEAQKKAEDQLSATMFREVLKKGSADEARVYRLRSG